MIAAPKTIQAGFAALGDFYTWRLAEKVYGHGSNEAWAAVCSFHIEWVTPQKSGPLTDFAQSCVAHPDRLQSMAVVLFHSYTLKLSRDYSDHRRTEFLAMALDTG